MKRRDFMKTAGLSLAAFTLTGYRLPACQRRKTRPNIIVILCDDLGYADIGCYGCKDIPTPNIDSIAQKGIRFTNGYVSAAECSPSRAGIMTGRYQQRFGHEFNPGPPPLGVLENIGLPLSESTIADILASAGYRTGAVGKWHLGTSPRFHPLKRGFHEFFGFPHGNHSYVDPQLDTYNPIMRGDIPVYETQYLTDAFTREAVSFIKRHRKQPFFLYLSYNAPHKPLEPPKRYQNSFERITKPERHAYACMLAAMDEGIGKVLAALREIGLEDDTLLFFLNDNGGSRACGANNYTLKGGKGWFFEGGIRVPFMVQWPKFLTGGASYDHPVISLDILPTIVNAAGTKLPKEREIDGVDLIPYLTGQNKNTPHKSLFWRKDDNYAVRQGNWKLVSTNSNNELFDLANDISETHNLAAERRDVLKELTKAYEKWNTQMTDPLWPDQIHETKAGEDDGTLVHKDSGLYIQSGRIYHITVRAKTVAGACNGITVYCWKGYWHINKTLITSDFFNLTSKMEDMSISFDSDNYAGQRLIVGYQFMIPPFDDKVAQVVVDKEISVSYSRKKADTGPTRPHDKRLK